MAETTQNAMASTSTLKDYVLREFLPGEDPGELTHTTELITSGVLDSVGVLKLVTFVEEQFGVQVEAYEADVDHFNTINDILILVESKQGA